ncbi:hypothetical protein KP509_34G008100 [Ceratopteris richardii]|nr:hypothetical protein KP509_34G008100 [Ceratopteris richardii]
MSTKKPFPSYIKNKLIRSLQYAKLKTQKKNQKKIRRKERDAVEKQAVQLGEAAPPRRVPRTIENTREYDETVARPDDDELLAEDAVDEFSAHFNSEVTPQLLITSSRWCSTMTIKFIAELLRVIPNAHYYKRGSYEIKQIVKYARNRNFTAIIIIHDNRKEPNGMLIISLPDGPTAHFKLSNFVRSKKIKGHGKPTTHLPELILNNFTTRIGHRLGRMLASLFPRQPNFRGRRVVTFHNQRDFIFFRHHRYIFEEKEEASRSSNTNKGSEKKSKKSSKVKMIARLQECGPRFTLKLISLQHGTFDSKYGEYEWVHKADMDTSRRRFFI